MDYHTDAGENLIRKWFDAQPEDIQAEVDIALLRLAGFQNWNEIGEFKILTEQHKGYAKFYSANTSGRRGNSG